MHEDTRFIIYISTYFSNSRKQNDLPILTSNDKEIYFDLDYEIRVITEPVANLFEDAKGGTLFIDEAYSLMDKNQADSFANEAMAEIIRQMENNPDTLVIFAGYTNKMREFIKQANPGLRSRLTNVLEFPD
ncbi:AAA family ATPase [Bacillaceae bacterium Marseille-Q3522]|nr:AAA family ATPase [Bacillaceae bacterium Marseille-Q3522]